jgi:agmatinase
MGEMSASLKFRPQQDGFLGLSESEAGKAADAKAVVIPFGLEATVSYGTGTRNGPEAIIAASPQLEFFDEDLWCEPYKSFGIATLEPVAIPQGVEDALTQLEGLVGSVVARGGFPLVLGGEHALTPGAIRPFAAKYRDLVVLQFDAHADLRDGYQGQPYSHAAAMRRSLDNPAVSLVQVGIRAISAEEIPFWEANQNRISTFWGKDLGRLCPSDVAGAVAGRAVYLTFDVDAFDSSLMPATGTPEPGGLSFDQAVNIIRSVSQKATIVGADVVELAPVSSLHACDFAAAKLAYKILAYSLLGRHL